MRVILVGLAVALLSAPAAAAECTADPSARDALGEAKAAFVGVVERADPGDRKTLVSVESIWLGDRLPSQVEVHRPTDQPSPFASGRRYLFVTDKVEGGIARQDACDLTAPYTERIAALEPDSAIGPIDERTPIWIGILVALLVVGAWQASRARRRAAELGP